MEIFKSIKEKHQAKLRTEIEQQAEDFITLQDFDDGLYIAYNGTIMAPIDPSWTTKEIVQQLSVFRNNYVASKMKSNGLPRMAAAL